MSSLSAMDAEQPQEQPSNSHLAALGIQVQGPSKRALADVLWEAANVYLSPTGKQIHGAPYSCWAIWMAQNGTRRLPNEFGLHTSGGGAAWEFIRSMNGGESLACSYMTEGSTSPRDVQSVRYMWLLLAMHVAEDEGLTV
jgi:hypothetical protein